MGGRVFPASGPAELLLAGEFEAVRRPEGDAVRAFRKPAPGRARAGIEIDIRLGFGETPEALPEPLRLAIRMLVAHWFENRGDLEDEARGLPAAVHTLLRPFRAIRL
jgi:uncharacterized phiE125 gp8 family phage protein